MSGFASLRPAPEDRFLAGLSPATRLRTLQRIAAAKGDPRKVSQAELDGYDDETRWDWLQQVCRLEAHDKEQAAAGAAQTRLEGHQ